jgi:DNA-binding GntR family transcriptional regulator
MAGPSQVERTLQEIKQRIVEGQYRPGAHLSEAMLARIHRSSRTPVREALSRLLQEGYVEFEPHRGYAAARITLAAVRHMFEVRRLLEADAAARAAAVVTAADVERLRALADSDYSPGTRAAYLAALARNQQFHLAVAESCGNPYLVDLVRQCLTKMDRVLSLGIDYAPFHDGSTAEHRAIVEALADGAADRARTAVERHLDHSHALLMEALVRGDTLRVGV